MKNFQQSAFSLEITSRNNEERITWDNCRALSEHRFEILERASQLGALVGPTNAHISVQTREMLHELARYVESYKSQYQNYQKRENKNYQFR